MDAELWKNLPEELLPAILARLPWWSNLQLRAVCRSWNSMLCSPQHLSRFFSASPPRALCCILSPGILSIAGRCALLNLPFRKWHALPRPSVLPNFNASDFFELEAASAGLLLMEGKLIEKGRVLINPLNKTHRWLPPVPSLEDRSDGHLVRGVVKEHTQGMHVDDITHNVRIIALQHQPIDGHVVPTTHFESFLSDLEVWRIFVYDLQRNAWDLISSLRSEHLQRIKNAIIVGNSVFILTKQPSSRHRHRHRIFQALSTRLLEVPAEITIDIPTVHLFRHRQNLLLVTGADLKRRSVDVWRLDQANENRWDKVASMPENLLYSKWCCRDFFCDVEGDCICFSSNVSKGSILVYDIVEKVWESVKCKHSDSTRAFLWQPRLDIVL